MSLRIWASAVFRAAAIAGDRYTFTVTLDRTFTDTPTYGGGNVDPLRFVHDGENWEVWQIIPHLGAAVDSSNRGQSRIQIRNRSKGRGQNTLAEMPDRMIIESAQFNGTPWEFHKTTNAGQFTNTGSGNPARKTLYFIAQFSPASSPANAGIAQGESMTVTFIWD